MESGIPESNKKTTDLMSKWNENSKNFQIRQIWLGAMKSPESAYNPGFDEITQGEGGGGGEGEGSNSF
jgi:hypothetical protein